MSDLTYTTHEDMRRVVMSSILPKVPTTVTKVVGVPRSGLLPAIVVATARHIRLGAAGVGEIAGGERTEHCLAEDNGQVLLIDDAISRGQKLLAAKRVLEENGREVITASVFIMPSAEKMVDIFGEYRKHPRVFEWNLFNHGLGPRMMYDMDGVLCQDPDVYDDDGQEYQAAIANAAPIALPRWPIGTICTNRIERWRGITEAWLSRYGVKYERLLMNPAPTAAERRKNQMAHKIRSYSESTAVLFIESSTHQARQIAQATGRPVLSLEENKLY